MQDKDSSIISDKDVAVATKTVDSHTDNIVDKSWFAVDVDVSKMCHRGDLESCLIIESQRIISKGCSVRRSYSPMEIRKERTMNVWCTLKIKTNSSSWRDAVSFTFTTCEVAVVEMRMSAKSGETIDDGKFHGSASGRRMCFGPYQQKVSLADLLECKLKGLTEERSKRKHERFSLLMKKESRRTTFLTVEWKMLRCWRYIAGLLNACTALTQSEFILEDDFT